MECIMAESRRNSVPVSLVRGIYLSQRKLNHLGAEVAKDYDLQLSEMDLINTLGNTRGMKMGSVATHMLISAPSVTRIVKRIEERGLVTRMRSKQSDREVIVSLTPEGEALFEKSYPHICDEVAKFFGEVLTGDEQQQLLQRLNQLTPESD